MESNKLKGLQVEKTSIEGMLDMAKEEVDKSVMHMQRIQRELQSVESKIENMSKKEIVVTEHALLRYIASVYKIDLEQEMNVILDIVGRKTEVTDATVQRDGLDFRIKNRNVVTVVG